jgi:hypothetical protein
MSTATVSPITTAVATPWATFGDVLHQLGDIPAERVGQSA